MGGPYDQEVEADQEDREQASTQDSSARRPYTLMGPGREAPRSPEAEEGGKKAMGELPRYTQDNREDIMEDLRVGNARTFRKRSRIVAVQLDQPFEVETDRGVMQGQAGDWLVTNHPDDDPGSDIWSISDERMRNTYEEAE